MTDPRFRTPIRKPAPAPEPDGMRLQKFLADAGLASRRDSELWVQQGRVRLNGRVVRELPCWVRPEQDLVEVDGETVAFKPRAARPGAASGPEKLVYFALNKPKGVISTADDPRGRPHVVGLVRNALPPGTRVFPVGRLDADSTGLILLTNDGALAHRLAHPRFGVSKEYRVTVEGTVDAAVLARLKQGEYLFDRDRVARQRAGEDAGPAGRRAAFANVRVVDRKVDRSRGGLALLSITLQEGQNREIRRLLARVGIKVRRLERVRLGTLLLGGLKPGAFRHLTEAEVTALRTSVTQDARVRAPARASGNRTSGDPTSGDRTSTPRPAAARRATGGASGYRGAAPVAQSRRVRDDAPASRRPRPQGEPTAATRRDPRFEAPRDDRAPRRATRPAGAPASRRPSRASTPGGKPPRQRGTRPAPAKPRMK